MRSLPDLTPSHRRIPYKLFAGRESFLYRTLDARSESQPGSSLRSQDGGRNIRRADSWIDCRIRSLSRWVALDGVMDKYTTLQ